MPRGGRPSRTPTPSAGPSSSQTTPSRFSLLQMMNEDNTWESDSSESGYSEYDKYRESDSDTVASSMLASILAPVGGGKKKKPKKKKGKGKATPAPEKTTSSGAFKTPTRKPTTMSELASMAEEEQQLEMENEMAEEIVGKAFTKVMDTRFAKLYSKIDNLKTEVSTLKTTVASLVEENKKLGEVRGNAPDPEMQPPATPATPKKDLTIRPRPVLPAQRKRAGTPLAQQVTNRNWAKQVEKDNVTPMIIDESDAEPGQPGKAP